MDQTDDSILKDKNLLDNVFSSPHVLIAYMDAKFNFIRVSVSYAQVDYKSPDYFIGKNHFNLYPNQENQAIFQQVVNTGRPYTARAKPFQYAYAPERGITYWDWTLQPIKDLSGKTTNLLLFLLDVTDRIKALEERMASEEKYRSLVENIPAVTWITNEFGITTYISPNVEKVYGFTPQEIYDGGDHLWFDRIHFDDRKRVTDAFQSLFQEEQTFDTEYRIQRKDGQWIWVQDKAIVVYEEEDEKFAYGIFSDITARKEAERAREDLEKRRAEFISLASHELRTPLTIVKGYFEILEKRFDNLSPEEKTKCFQITDKNINRLERLMSGVRELTMIERGKFSLNLKIVEFNSLLTEVLSSFQNILGDQLTLIHPTKDLPCFIEIDADRITQVLDNIIQNAVDHTSKFERKIMIECDTQMKNTVKILIRDNGAGIAPEKLEDIFSPFVSIPTKYSAQGTGIGLFLSRSIIESHNGLIYAESPGIDKGSTFIIELPKRQN